MKLRSLVLMIAIIVSSHAAPAQQNMTQEDIITALRGGEPSNSLTTESIISALRGDGPRPTADSKELFAKIKEKEKTRSFTIKDREEVENFSVERPKISIEVYFDYNSAEITDSARSTLDKLGSALQDPTLADKKFIFRGHTDARGSPGYNLQLSDRRAAAVKKYIVSSFRVEERRIASIGSGALNLKNQANPFADENRRVEVVRSD